ncbi:MAG TPA: urease accessory protein UreD [Pontibacter sp.]
MINELKISVANRSGKTYLKDMFYTRPFKVAHVGEDKADPRLYLMVMSSSPGILDGDQYEQTIDLAEDTSLQLQTQSYQRLFQMERGAGQVMKVNMARGSSFHYIPHPSVPHENSIYKSHNVIRMEEGCSLIWGEIVTCGRKLSGEVFKFKHFQNLTEVYCAGKLVFKDNLLLSPGYMSMNALGQFEEFTHQATLFCLNENAGTAALTDLIQEQLSVEKNIAFGVTQTAHNGLLVRVLGHGGEQLLRCLNELGALYQKKLRAIVAKEEALILQD